MSLLVAALAVAIAPYTVTCKPDSTLTITRETRPIATVGYQAASPGWVFAPLSAQKDGTVAAKLPDAEVAVKTVATSEDGGVRLTVEATPSADAKIESSHLAIQLPASWAGGTARMDLLPMEIPSYEKELQFYSGKVTTIDLSKGREHLVVSLPEATPVVFQDSRRFGAGFDLRIGASGAAETWLKGQSRKYSVLIKGDSPMELLQNRPLEIQAGPDWIPLDTKLDVAPGSALDWSPKNVSPAGSHGWVIVTPDGHFAFEKTAGQNERFYGANLVFSAAMPDHATADELADRLMRLGYNSVRLHHFDRALSGDDSGSTSTVIAKDPMDRMDYLVAAMKKRGIYTTLDLYTIRQIRPGELLPGKVGMDEYKAMLLVDPKARDNWWAFASAILEHKNPYTGLAWKDDPAIAWLCVVNENTLGSAIRSAGPEVKAMIDQAWQAAGHQGSWSYETDEGAKFAAQLHSQAYAWMRDKIRGIGCRALLTDLNGWHQQTALALERISLDYVDSHTYWDHPSFLGGDWGLPSRGWSGGGMATQALGGGLQSLALERIARKPFTVSEFNFVAPNRYRAEAGLFMGALAARQDWDAMWRFAWSHSDKSLQEPAKIDYFDVQSDPIALSTERAIISLFLHRDMTPAPNEAYVRLFPSRVGASGFANPISTDLFDTRIGSTMQSGLPGSDGVNKRSAELPPFRIDQERGVLMVDTPRTAGVFAPVGERTKAGPLTVTFDGNRGALWANSLDGFPLVSSERILLTHLTDVQNTGVRFAAEDRDVLTDWGKLPHLVRAGSAMVEFLMQRPERAKVYRLDMAGNRIEEVPVKATVRGIQFETNVKGPQGATLYYEIVKVEKRDEVGGKR